MSGLPVIDVSGRAPRLRAAWSALDAPIDALVVGDLTNIRWLTGFTGSAATAVVLGDEVVVITDGRYGDQAERQLAMASCRGRVRVGLTQAEQVSLLADTVRDAGPVGFESAHTSHARWLQLEDALARDLVPTVGLIEAGRRVKDHAELARIERACAIADEALARVAPTLAPGRTEAQVRDDLELAMRDLGADGPSYETIVATGPVNAPMPHHRPTRTVLELGHTVIIDVGALVDGYHSDMTRTYVIGEPTPLQQEVYDAVLAAQAAGVAAVRPGISSRDLDAVCRDLLADAGFGPWFVHGTGHGVGLLIHEDPFVNSSGGWVLQAGDVVTVEPGVYRGDFGGVRVEDLVEVTSTGGRALTTTPKDSPCPPSPPTI
ncbi:MAG: Xaa-Pro peptidase family protein [Ilumatobacteraceae bacterium]|nr:aminopeptidase P family protein [Acidimicrobiales bacterium]